MFGEWLLFSSGVLMLLSSLILTLKSRFVQLRKLPLMFKLLFHPQGEGEHTVKSRHALFTAMSTTLGLSTIVAPIIAIRLGGPGVVLGFLLSSFFGAALNYAEVKYALTYRSVGEGGVRGGPMGYLASCFSPWLAKWYALVATLLMLGWSAAQANQLSAMLASPLMGPLSLPTWLSGLVLAATVIFVLIGGIKRIARFSSKLVPLMFVLYTLSALIILFVHARELPAAFTQIWVSCFHPQSFATGALVGGILSTFRWGVMKGLQGSEAGIGTQTIPHSMAEIKDPDLQATLSMVSTYTAGFLLILSSLVALVTKSWLDPTLPLGISMVASSFEQIFSYFGLLIVIICTLLFAFGTILGNSFNGSQCYLYLTKNRKIKLFYFATAALVFVGSVSNVTLLWSSIDYILALMMVPHVLALIAMALFIDPADQRLPDDRRPSRLSL